MFFFEQEDFPFRSTCYDDSTRITVDYLECGRGSIEEFLFPLIDLEKDSGECFLCLCWYFAHLVSENENIIVLSYSSIS